MSAEAVSDVALRAVRVSWVKVRWRVGAARGSSGRVRFGKRAWGVGLGLLCLEQDRGWA